MYLALFAGVLDAHSKRAQPLELCLFCALLGHCLWKWSQCPGKICLWKGINVLLALHQAHSMYVFRQLIRTYDCDFVACRWSQRNRVSNSFLFRKPKFFQTRLLLNKLKLTKLWNEFSLDYVNSHILITYYYILLWRYETIAFYILSRMDKQRKASMFL